MTARSALSYNQERGRWEGEEEQQGQHLLLWVDETTLEGHVRAHLQAQGVTQPTLSQAIIAVKDCVQLSHWQGSPDAHRVPLVRAPSLS